MQTSSLGQTAIEKKKAELIADLSKEDARKKGKTVSARAPNAKPHKKQKQKRSVNTPANPVLLKTLGYDSKSSLLWMKKSTKIDGSVLTAIVSELDLSKLSEREKQLVILATKASTQHYNGSGNHLKVATDKFNNLARSVKPVVLPTKVGDDAENS